MKKIRNILLNNKGDSILGYVIVAPFLLYFTVYLILGGAYFLKINDMTNICNKKLDRALVQGQFTTSLQTELINELVLAGFHEDNLTITISPAVAGDSNNDTYIERGNEIQVTIIYKKPHRFYYPNKFFSSSLEESKFYIGTKISGMSEKW